MQKTTKILSQRGIHAPCFTVASDQPGFDKLMTRYEIVSFSVVLAAGKGWIGAGSGKWAFRTSKLMPAFKIFAGILLIVLGFHFLVTL